MSQSQTPPTNLTLPRPHPPVQQDAARASTYATQANSAQQLYDNKTVQDVVNQDINVSKTQPALTDSVNKILETQIERGVNTEHSSQVLTKLIDCLCQSVVGQVTGSNGSVEQRQTAAMSNQNAARVFTHSLCHILDDSLVWMDAVQVSSTASSSFDTSRFQQSVIQNMSQVRRDVAGQYLFEEWWNSCTAEERQRFIVNCVQAYGQSCANECMSAKAFCEQGNIDLLTQLIDQIGAQLCNRGGGSNAASSVQDICNTFTNCFNSCFSSNTSGQVCTTMTPSFITNWCVYKNTFQSTLQSTSTEGDCSCDLQPGGCPPLAPVAPVSCNNNGSSSSSSSTFPCANTLGSAWQNFCRSSSPSN